MCGIVGIIGSNSSQSDTEASVRKMRSVLTHRGPDENGVLSRESVTFGHTRLSIIDLASGQQPMMDGDFLLTFNGEIYNYLEIKKQLLGKGYSFKTQSDSEVLLKAYQEWKEECVLHFRGMFAFVIYDFKKKTFFAARDPFGQKPLYYTQVGSLFLFASEASALLKHSQVSRDIDRQKLGSFLIYEGLNEGDSLFKGIQKLPPGHSLAGNNIQLKLKRYWTNSPGMEPCKNHSSLPDIMDLLDQRLKESVALHTRSDVPIGLSLSGGLDSSLILAYLRELFPSKTLRTYTIKNSDSSFNESSYAKIAADTFSTEHREIPLSFEKISESIPSILEDLDEPQADPGIIPKYLLYKEASQELKVLLGGDGADELFYGYITFKGIPAGRLYRLFPKSVRQKLFPLIVKQLRNSSKYMGLDLLAQRFLRGADAPIAVRNQLWIGSFTPNQLNNLLLSPIESNLLQFNDDLWEENKSIDERDFLGKLYQRTYLPNYVLCGTDRVSMKHSLEVRAPFLDPELSQWTNQLPASLKLRGWKTKYILKKLAERRLPQKLVRRKKMGFTIPMAKMLRTSLSGLLKERLSFNEIKKQGWFSPNTVQTMIQDHITGKQNHYKPLWTLLSLKVWWDAQQ